MLLIKEGRNFSIVSECHEPRIPQKFRDLGFSKIIKKVLGAKSFVSIVFVRQKKMQRVNQEYRDKSTSTDILSFGLSGNESKDGEILLSLNDMRKKARSFGVDPGEYLSYLLIHGLLHLKGGRHGSKMNRQEKQFCKLFRIKYPF